jgi:hypothetical protein
VDPRIRIRTKISWSRNTVQNYLVSGVPVPFSNLGTIIDELFIPTMMVQDSYENHAKKAKLSHEDLVKFRYGTISSG